MTSREEVLKVYPDAREYYDRTIRRPNFDRSEIKDVYFLGVNWDDAASKLPPGSPAVNYLSGHDDPTLTETCPVCGASRKPGDKCLCCGQQPRPAGETASEPGEAHKGRIAGGVADPKLLADYYAKVDSSAPEAAASRVFVRTR